MGKKLKSATNNQWVSTTVDPNMVPAKDRPVSYTHLCIQLKV